MAEDRPPTIDPVAADRWQRRAPAHSPWLHEEVGRRMEERLEWIRREPASWVDWEPVRGGLAAHARVAQRYARSRCLVVEPHHEAAARAALAPSLWQRLRGDVTTFGDAPDGAAQMLWSNMRLHTSADPQQLLARWHRALEADGFLMFSCLGPDTLRELRALYAALGWPPPSHEFTDMHDWGDMLVHTGFAEPVMDMERITLTFETPARLVAELRELGANLHPQRFPALRGRAWRRTLEEALGRDLRGAEGRLALTFEVIYGHALKPQPRVKVGEKSTFSVDDMRRMLQRPPQA
ncbi:methyltransferase domain-containing protein [Ramlibacter albus]|uniref:Methyltransferase domain-containing protein n=1 Tax=Ramlibacter albus TaxID=2079448 RepID=A0A923M571_9BURK|nr:methyltransferase domain-containing protein [Ramlibacter albus]MBC5763138.1 methyltransferase domain-containing protein [Ramlibacter albus]